jgi:hypothetical protein
METQIAGIAPITQDARASKLRGKDFAEIRERPDFKIESTSIMMQDRGLVFLGEPIMIRISIPRVRWLEGR